MNSNETVSNKMASSKKYAINLEEIGDSWSAKVTRRVSSKTHFVTMEKTGFSCKQDAQVWADKGLAELTDTQKSSNVSQGQKRKDILEMKRQRSARRAEKTENEKSATLNLNDIKDNDDEQFLTDESLE